MYTSPVLSTAPAVRGVHAYKSVDAQSSSPLQLVVMLYDGAIKFLGQAREAHQRGDLRGRATGLSRTLAIVSELQSTLNLEQGGVVAQDLDRLYQYVTSRLVDVTTKRDPAAIDEVLGLLGTLRDGWAQASSGSTPTV